ncbi:5'-3' exonuclease [Mycoplasmopsis columbinasalis]|uniref:5'-3' exonuclease n=1 Tax=Mycoplasmopsis columbinasalis TaxID=114880 RepID=A0A449BAM4_9BACT|nr:5'-3' exonuclease H3TH domain-containing protein [Mycoplasmopsis columbinasalis]VEU78217.1 DNA polymerase I [Mycoplasmopsis columbinasalis]
MNKFLLIDGNLLMFKSFYATYNPNVPEKILKNSKGIYTNAIYVFLKSLFKILDYINPTHLMIAFDASSQTWRKQEFANYKEGRSKTPEILFSQFDILKVLLTKLNCFWLQHEGDEADDIIATFTKNPGFHYYVFSNDKDLLQLVDENVTIVQTGKTDYENPYKIISNQNFFQIFNLFPNQIPDFKGLAGDSSDNIPGVNQIGEKKAITLLQKFGNIDSIYKNIDEIKSKLRENLENEKELAFFYKKIATLNKDVQIDYSLGQCINFFDGDLTDAIKMLEDLELKSIANRIKNFTIKW